MDSIWVNGIRQIMGNIYGLSYMCIVGLTRMVFICILLLLTPFAMFGPINRDPSNRNNSCIICSWSLDGLYGVDCFMNSFNLFL